jgi:CRISPR-associated protein Csm4
MNYSIYKLKFPDGVHFGESAQKAGLDNTAMTCHADTLFSALTQECLALFGEETTRQWVERAKEGKFLLSSLMPFDRENLYIPRPALSRRVNNTSAAGFEDSTARKRMNKLRWIPIRGIQAYLAYLAGAEFSFPEITFGRTDLTRRVNLRDGEESQPYSVSGFYFQPDAGLYMIVGCEESFDFKTIDVLLNSLARTGLGGKRNLGMGCFEIQPGRIDLSNRQSPDQDLNLLMDYLSSPAAAVYMALSPVLPHEEEVSGIKERLLGYSLLERRGFIQSETYRGQNLKRRPCVMLEPGSCMSRPARGCLLDLRPENFPHPVYRFGIGMYIPLAAGKEAPHD